MLQETILRTLKKVIAVCFAVINGNDSMGKEFNLREVEFKPVTRFEKSITKERRKAFERNIQSDGVFARTVVHVMISDLEHYFRKKRVALIEISNRGVELVLKDNTRVRVK